MLKSHVATPASVTVSVPRSSSEVPEKPFFGQITLCDEDADFRVEIAHYPLS
jgi:hypothetical protein